MACRLFCATPLSKPILVYYYLERREQISVNINQIKIHKYSLWKNVCKIAAIFLSQPQSVKFSDYNHNWKNNVSRVIINLPRVLMAFHWWLDWVYHEKYSMDLYYLEKYSSHFTLITWLDCHSDILMKALIRNCVAYIRRSGSLKPKGSNGDYFVVIRCPDSWIYAA